MANRPRLALAHAGLQPAKFPQHSSLDLKLVSLFLKVTGKRTKLYMKFHSGEIMTLRVPTSRYGGGDDELEGIGIIYSTVVGSGDGDGTSSIEADPSLVPLAPYQKLNGIYGSEININRRVGWYGKFEVRIYQKSQENSQKRASTDTRIRRVQKSDQKPEAKPESQYRSLYQSTSVIDYNDKPTII
ncbi:hypothetical protein Tco_0580801 [Tanacetum coccineum]